jgi:hypothetical protein
MRMGEQAMKTLRTRLVIVLWALISAFPAPAQVTGSITGTVRDSSGAVIPGAKVSVYNNDRGIHRDTLTDSSGDYLVQGLNEGTYTVAVAVAGFKKFLATNTVVHVGENVRIDAALEVGSVTTEITVRGSNAGIVETQSSEESTTIDSTQISQLELNGRSFVQLIELSPGVSNQTGQSEGTTGPNGSVSYAVNGGRTEFNNWEIDGGDVMDAGSMANLNVFPNVDALDQIQILTSGYDAEYGRSAGATVEAVTKSGTNEFHGELFEYLRNQMFNAANYFNPPGTPAAAYKKHDFGGTLGGPIIRNKLFFFYSEELRRENVPSFYDQSVPSNAERAGDFSAVCPTPGTIFTRNIGTQYPYYPDCPAYALDAAQDGGVTGFPSNNIAPYISKPNAGLLLAVLPQANTIQSGFPFLDESVNNPYSTHQELFRIDYGIKPNLRLSFRYIHDQDLVVQDGTTPWNEGNLPGLPGQEVYPGISMVTSLQWTASPTLTNEVMAGYGSNSISITNSTAAANTPAGLTMTSLFPNSFGGKIPTININGGVSYDPMIQDAGPTPFNNSNPTYTYRDTLTKLIHSHNLKTGFYFTANQKNEDGEVWTQGEAGFSANASSSYTQPIGPIPSTGDSFADFLLGELASYTQYNTEVKYHFHYRMFEPFVQDDWRVARKLTLNLGLRMSFFSLYTEKNNLSYVFDPAAYKLADAPTLSPVDGHLIFPAGQSVATITGIVHCGTNGIPAGCLKGNIWNPAPRVGFSYDPFGNGKTAIRAAYGIFYDHTNGNDDNTEGTEDNPPLILNAEEFYIQGYTNIKEGEYFPMVPIALSASVYPFNYSQVISKMKWPSIQQWHLDIQRQLMRDTMATIAYVGSHGTHLTVQDDLNQLHDLPASQNPFPPGVPITDESCANDTLPDGTPVTGEALVHLNIACYNVDPDYYRNNFPGYDGISGMYLGGSSSYDALQVSGRRTARTLQLTLAYTYSHSIDNASDRYDGSFVDSYHMNRNRASSDFDQRHILNFSYIYTLPVLARRNRLMRGVFGGWQYSGITEIQTGDPTFLVGPNYDNAGVANYNSTGSYVDKAPGISDNVSHFSGSRIQAGIYGPLLFNPSAFNMPQGLTFGDEGRNSLSMPRTSNFDMGLFKHFPIKEKTTIEFRTEAFNVFNHPEFTGINNSAPDCYGANDGYTYNFGYNACVQGVYGPSSFLHPDSVHDPRIAQFALKVIF